MGEKRRAKKAEKLANAATVLREKADEIEVKAAELSPDGEVPDVSTDDESGGGKLKLLTTLLAVLGGVGFYLKKKREQELDEALWEEPRAL